MTNPATSLTRRTFPFVPIAGWVLADLHATLLFVGLYGLTGSVLLATALSTLGSLFYLLYRLWRGRQVDAIQWLSLGLVVILGGASLLTQDPRFIMFKPTLVYAAIGAVMLRRGWMARYMPERVLQVSRDVVELFGSIWAGLMFATAIANLALVWHGDRVLWAEFLGIFPLGSKIALIFVQYWVTRMIIRRRLRGLASGAVA